MEGIEAGDFPIYQWPEIQQLIDNHVEPGMLRGPQYKENLSWNHCNL
jgi:hypothetical protein